MSYGIVLRANVELQRNSEPDDSRGGDHQSGSDTVKNDYCSVFVYFVLEYLFFNYYLRIAIIFDINVLCDRSYSSLA
jgi:hypothetical protein